MAEIVLEDVWKVFPDGTEAVRSFDLDIAGWGVHRSRGPVGVRQDHRAAHGRRPRDDLEGDVTIGDRVVNDVPPKERDIAMVFQNYALYPHMSVYDNMAFGLKLHKMPRQEIDDGVQEAARILGLGELLKRKPAALSGGQRQRVAMDRAIVRHPQAFLMDEPLSNLDAKLRVQTRPRSRLQDELGVTTIYVTHDQVEAMTMGDRVAVMRKGVLQQVDTPQSLYEHPTNLFVAGFIGSPAMNMVEASLVPADGALAVKLAEFQLRCRTRSWPSGPICASTRGARSSSASAPRTWRMRRWSRRHRPSAASPRPLSCARRWARTSSRTSRSTHRHP